MPWKPIQTQPQGLLGFLQMKNAGKNPTDLPETLQSTLDLFQWMQQTNMESVQTAIAAFTTAGVKAIVVVPQGEWWFVDAIDVILTQDVGGAVEYAIGYSYGGFAITRLLSPLQSFAIAGGANTASFMTRERPLFVPPGAQLQLIVRSVTVGVTSGQCMVRFKRLQV